MKKAIAILSIAALAMAVGVSAKTRVFGNSCDDCAVITNVNRTSTLNINASSYSNSTSFIATNASTGGSAILAGDDVVNSSITTGNALNTTDVLEETGSVVIEYDALGSDADGSEDVEVSGNSGDDPLIVVNDTTTQNETVATQSASNSTRFVAANSNSGLDIIGAGEDVDTAAINNGSATTDYIGTFYTGNVSVKRNR